MILENPFYRNKIMDVLIVALATTVAILTSFYLFGISQVKFLKKNWVQYRCNPIYMPMAGFVGDNVFTNFTKCTMKGFQDYAGFMMDPIMGEFAVVNETLTEIGGAMNSMRQMTSSVRGGFLGIIGTVFGKIQNLVSQFQYIIIRMRTLLGRIVGVMLSFIYVFYTGMETGDSVMAGPIGQTVSFLCFNPDTPVMLKDNSKVSMKDLKIGDELFGGNRVISLYVVDGGVVPLYNLYGTIVSGSHRVKYMSSFIRVDSHPDSIPLDFRLPRLACLNTDTHKVLINGIQYLDFVETDKVINAIHQDSLVVIDNDNAIPISHVELGTKLKNKGVVLGRVWHEDGLQLITTTGSIPILVNSSVIKLVPDEIKNILE